MDLSLGKIAVIGFLALLLVGPDRLPKYAAQLAKWVRVVRGMADEAKSRVAAEMGPEFEDVDWAKLDPRRYHPKRILADAWNSTTAPDDVEPAPDATRDEAAPAPTAQPVTAAEDADAAEIAEPTEPGILELYAQHQAQQAAAAEAA